MDDEGEEMARRRRLKPEAFVRSSLVSSCATPRHHWRSPSWTAAAAVGDTTTSSSSSRPPPSTAATSQPSTAPRLASPSECESLLQSLSIAPEPKQQQQQPVPESGKTTKRPPIKLDLGALLTARDGGGGGGKPATMESPRVMLSESDGELLERRERMAECERQCTRVAPHLYFGGRAVAENYALLRRYRITHVLNCAASVCPVFFPVDFAYKTLCLQDSPSEDLGCILYDAFDFIEGVRQQAAGRVLVHCCQGVSRSASLVIAYIMWRERRSFDSVLGDLKSRRSVTSPNIGFIYQLTQWQRRVLDADRQPPPSTPMVYRIAPHCAADPMLLIPKTMVSPPAGAMDGLDSRGVFVVRMPTRLYVWRGRGSDKAMAAAGDRAAFQLVRYEHAQGPIVVVAEGREPPYLLGALLKRDALLVGGGGGGGEASENSGAYAARVNHPHPGRARFGYKLVAAYDADFDMYRRARANVGAGTGSSLLADYNSGGNPPTPPPPLGPPLSARVGRWRLMRPEMSYYVRKW